MTGLTVLLDLTCSVTGERSDGQLTLNTLPPLGLDLKREIELAHEIPAFAQTLSYGGESHSANIADDDAVSSALIRHGDTLRVTYTSKAECKDVQRAVEYLKQLVTSFREQSPAQSSTANDASRSAALLDQVFSGGIVQLLRNELFMPWRSSVKQMNKEVFLRAGGLECLLQLLRFVHTSNWETSIRQVKLLEIVLLEALHPLAANFRFRRLLVQEGVVELSFKSLLRHRLERRAVFREDLVTPYLLAKAMTTLCNLCELHETHVKIGSDREVLEQLICIAHSSHYDTWHAQVVLNLLACVAHAREVHPHLASDQVIGGITDVCVHRAQYGDCSAIELMLLRYYAQLVFIQLILVSPLHLSQTSLEKTDTFLTKFLRDVDPIALSQEEKTSGNFWSVFEPFVSLLYVPRAWLEEDSLSPQRKLLLERLWLSSTQSALLVLQVIVLCLDDGHRSLDIMQRENLISFIVVAPTHVPESLRPQATEVVLCLRRYVSVGPPSLSDLAKASLARYQFGLERMLHLHSPHQLLHEYYCV